MGTRTAIFQAQKDGGYKGIYVQFDGYIEGVGAVLHQHYQDRAKTQGLIDQHEGLDSLGVENRIIAHPTTEEDYDANRSDDGYLINSIGGRGNEYFKADTLEQIRNFEYPNYTDNGEASGYVNDKGEFIRFIGSDNNGYLYVQTEDGEWLVSRQQGDEMSGFELLARYFEADDIEKIADRISNYENLETYAEKRGKSRQSVMDLMRQGLLEDITPDDAIGSPVAEDTAVHALIAYMRRADTPEMETDYEAVEAYAEECEVFTAGNRVYFNEFKL